MIVYIKVREEDEYVVCLGNSYIFTFESGRQVCGILAGVGKSKNGDINLSLLFLDDEKETFVVAPLKKIKDIRVDL